jgi:predicted GTPase
MADLLLINKVDAASEDAVLELTRRCRAVNPAAVILRGASPVRLDDAAAVAGKRVLVIEDGPTITHGGMPHGAGYVAALAAGAAEIIDPRPTAPPEIAAVFAAYPHIGKVLPAVGYGAAQLRALAAAIAAAPAEIVVSATPIDLARLIAVDKPMIRAQYSFAETGEPGLARVIDRFLDGMPAAGLR